MAWFRCNELARRLESIPGIGVITASALAATLSADTIKASGSTHRIDRPDTRLHPTKPPSHNISLAIREPSTQDIKSKAVNVRY